MNVQNPLSIREIQSKIRAMLEERASLSATEGVDPARPSQYWSDFCSAFDYMLELPEESFAKLRLHTYHLTGDNYQTYYFGDPETFYRRVNLGELTRDIPSQYVLNEPPGGIGFRYPNGRFVSFDIVKFQRVVNTLYREGVFDELSSRDGRRASVVEIGGGYGGLAHHLSNIVGESTYLLIDLPETLLFAAAYLSSLDRDKTLYLYDKSDFEEVVRNRWEEYRFILVPNYVLDDLRHLRFDLAINVGSFQEMRTDQVASYLDFLRETLTGVLYSLNQDREPKNRELTSLSDMLKDRFGCRGGSGIDLTWKQRMRMIAAESLNSLEKTLRRVLGREAIISEDRRLLEYVCRARPKEGGKKEVV